MAIPTSRTKEAAEIKINGEKCNGCGLCVSVCKDFNYKLENKKVTLSGSPLFGCIACGHCMAICPTNAIEIHGRELSPEDLFALPDRAEAATYEQFLPLLQRRRSIREFKEMPVENDLVVKILDAAKTAPMGLPPSDVNVLVLDNQAKVRAFASDYCDFLEGMKWFVSDWFIALMKPFWGKEND
jgi:ferredoxin